MNSEFSLFRRRGGNRQRFIFGVAHGSRCKRFEALQQAIVSRASESLSASARFVGLLIALEGIATAADWQAAYAAIVTRHCIQGRWRIAWLTGKGHPDARMLSPITVKHAQSVGTWLTFEKAREELWTFLCGQRIYPPTASSDDALQDALDWLQSNVGTIFAAHISGVSRLTPLPESALARGLCKLPLRPDDSEVNEVDASEPSLQYDLISDCFEAALLGRKAELGSDESFITDVLIALKPTAADPFSVQRSKIQRALRRLVPSLNKVSEAAALLFAYAWELVTRGTLRKERAAPGTPRAYVRAIAQAVLAEFAGSPISSLEDDEYRTKLSRIAEGVQGSPPKLAALRGFHRFLRSWWNAPVLPYEVFGSALEPSVAANIVWPHESALVDSWLAATPDVRLHEQVRVALAIGRCAAVRATEVLVLRCRNVIVEDDHVVIEIAREPTDGKEKTAEGRRRVAVHDPDAVRLLVSWLERRITIETALPRDYFFGEPSNAELVHRRGHMYYLMNMLLKVATGDDAVSFHTLRHTFVTLALHRCWMARTDSEVDQAAQIAADAGHVGAHVSARYYGHKFEEVIRDRVDRAVLAKVSASALASWLGCSHDAMRQILSRGMRKAMLAGNMDVVGARVEAISEQFTGQCLPSEAPNLGSICASAGPTSPLIVGSTVPSMLTVWRVLADLAGGLTLQVAALRQAVPHEFARRISCLVGEFAERHGKYHADRVSHDLHGQVALRDRTGLLLGLRVAFRADLIDRLPVPDASDSPDTLQCLRDACEYWARNIHRDQLAAAPGSSLLRPFLLLLKSLHIPATALSVRTSGQGSEDEGHIAIDTVTAIQAAFGMSVPIVRTGTRAGRAPAYIVISLNSEKPSLRGHGASMLWFHSVMLAAWVWLEHLKENSIAV